MAAADFEVVRKLRHDLSNPLAAILAETQLLLLNETMLDAETVQGLREPHREGFGPSQIPGAESAAGRVVGQSRATCAIASA